MNAATALARLHAIAAQRRALDDEELNLLATLAETGGALDAPTVAARHHVITTCIAARRAGVI